MKFKFEVECTPDEARQCLGLPNVAPLQERMLSQIEAKMQENLRYFDPDALIKSWLSVPFQTWGEMQKALWSQMGGVKTSSKGD
jgi:hypothetical protein